MDRLNVLDAQFLHMEDEQSPMHVACLCVFEGPVPDRDATTRMMNAKLQFIPRYRMRARTLPLELGRPVWVDDPHFDLGYHMRRTALPAPGDDAALHTLVGRLMSPTLDRDRPLWELWIVEGLDRGRWALISKIHHSMVDGISGIDLIATILDKERDQPLPAAVPWTPSPEPSGTALVLNAWRGLAEDAARVAGRLLQGARTPRAGTRALVDLGAGLTTFIGKLLTLHEAPIQGKIGKHRHYARASTSLADVQLIRKAFGGSVNDVVLTVVTGGYRALLQTLEGGAGGAFVRSLVPVSVRPPGEQKVLHNKVSAMLADLPLDIADPVERLRAISAQMDRLKASHMAEAGAMVVDIGDLAPPFVVGALTRLVVRVMHQLPQRSVGTVTTNIPGPREPLYCLGRRLLEWSPYVPIAQGVRLTTAILSYAGQLSFGLTSDADTLSATEVAARAIARGVDELVALARAKGPGAARA